jgi:hypothetical protein
MSILTETAWRIGGRAIRLQTVRQFSKEVWRFLRQEKKWWLIPLAIFFLLLAGLVYFTQGRDPISPFMYSIK